MPPDQPDSSAATTVDLLAEAMAIRNRLYYGAKPNSPAERDANRLGRVLFLIREQVTKPYGN